MITRKIEQVKMLKIERPPFCIDYGMGGYDSIKGHIYYEGFFISDEDTEQKIAQAKNAWEEERQQYGMFGKCEEVEYITWWENYKILKKPIDK